jgi:hypothetical protein
MTTQKGMVVGFLAFWAFFILLGIIADPGAFVELVVTFVKVLIWPVIFAGIIIAIVKRV